MNCPNCGKSNAGSASFCIFCGTPLATNSKASNSASRFKGSLPCSFSSVGVRNKTVYTKHGLGSEKDPIPAPPKMSEEKERGRDSGDEAQNVRASGLKTTMGKPRPAKKTEVEEGIYTYCKKCGRKLQTGGKCPVCYTTGRKITKTGKSKINKAFRPWLIAGSIAVIFILVIGIASAIANKQTNAHPFSTPYQNGYSSNDSSIGNAPSHESTTKDDPLSSTCDYILCVGYDTVGNEYELVANQSETPHGFEISVGVIKNDSWLYPLSNSFPFLAEDGLFHVKVSTAGESGTSLKHPGENTVISNLYFIDSGAFLLDCYKANDSLSLYDHYYIIFSCDTLTSTRIDCDELTLLYQYREPSFMSGRIEEYGQIYTDNGKLIMYTETSGTNSGWTSDQVFKWEFLDTRSLKFTTIADNVRGIRPRSVLSEGVFFCTDKCFYNTNGQKTVDLTEYSIDVWDDGDIAFEGGTCTFEVENSIGTRFRVTVDESGTVISGEAA